LGWTEQLPRITYIRHTATPPPGLQTAQAVPVGQAYGLSRPREPPGDVSRCGAALPPMPSPGKQREPGHDNLQTALSAVREGVSAIYWVRAPGIFRENGLVSLGGKSRNPHQMDGAEGTARCAAVLCGSFLRKYRTIKAVSWRVHFSSDTDAAFLVYWR